MRTFLVLASAVWMTIGTRAGAAWAGEAGGGAVREISVGAAGREPGGADPHTIQEAIDRMAGLGGGTVRIGPGRYVLRSALALRSNVRVIGAAGGTVLTSCAGAQTRLARDATPNSDQIVLADDAAFRVGDGVAIRDDRSPSSFGVTTATLLEKTAPKTFRLSAPLTQAYAVSARATVVRAFPVVGGWNVHHATVEGLTIDGNRPQAEALDGCRGAGIYLYACQDVTIRNCTVRNYRGDGISFQWSSQGVTIEDCLVENCAVFGLHPGSDSHHSLVRRNCSVGNGGPGVFVCENVRHVVFEKNNLRRNQGPGISTGCRDADNIFRENTIAGNGRTGILFRDDGGEAKGAHRNVFEHNVVIDNGPAGKDTGPAGKDTGSAGNGQPLPACVTILGSHRDLVFRNNTLGNSQPGGPAGSGILVVGEAQGLTSEANQFLNLKTEVERCGPRVPARPAADPRSEQFLPRGVYWTGGATFQECPWPESRWRRIDAALDDLAAHRVNAVWLTHLSAAETAQFARRAAQRGIYLVAALGELAGEVGRIRKGDHEGLIRRTIQAWGDAPKPIAWGLGDEPRTPYMHEMAAYVEAWRKHAPGEPVTTVATCGDVEAAGKAGFDALACDVYPFFSPGNPHAFGGPPPAAWLRNTRRLVEHAPRGWMMGQAFQEPWGPFELDERGDIVYLPGGAPHWVMPAPAQVRWQALAAVALGAKGMFYFHYRALVRAKPRAGPAQLPAAAKEKSNSHSPPTLVYGDGRPTPQYEALGEAFAWLERNAPRLAPLRPAAAAEAWQFQPSRASGDVVGLLVHPATARRYLMVVAGCDRRESRPIRITLGPHVAGLKSMTTGRDVAVDASGQARQVECPLAPGTAELLECHEQVLADK
ncbi:MAG: right-handed parallel beta-helix repeat-containing protein [Thermoguttaceae bacterium]